MKAQQIIHGKIAGISLLIMAVAAGFAYGYAQNELLGSTSEITMSNLIQSTSLFFGAIAAWGIILITDIFVSISLFKVFAPINWRISLSTAFIRIVYSIILAVAIFKLLLIVPAVNNANFAFDVNLYFQSFTTIWSIGLIVFGFHLIGLGILCLRSSFIHKLVGYLLCFAGVSYTFLHSARVIFPNYLISIENIENILSLPMGLSEMILAIILIRLSRKNLTNS